jgi:hypothetical protein
VNQSSCDTDISVADSDKFIHSRFLGNLPQKRFL